VQGGAARNNSASPERLLDRMKSTLSIHTIRFLKIIGFEEDDIARMGPSTTLQTDLRLDGDNLIDALLALQKFGVDMTGFNYDRYGRSEAFHMSAWRIYDNVRGIDPLRDRKLITLAMIEDSLLAARWLDPGGATKT
jgi:Protein of unknown function (DUF1493)